MTLQQMSQSKYPILTEDLITEIAQSPKTQRNSWLFLDPHPEYPGQWSVSSLDKGFVFDFDDIIGSYRIIAPARLRKLLTRAEERGYQVCFTEPPEEILNAYTHLDNAPPFAIESTMPNTVEGFLKFQLQGFNFLKDLRGGVAQWSTGAGKTVLTSALLKYHHMLGNFDTAFVLVRNHNKTNTQRALQRLVGLESTVVDGKRERKQRLWYQVGETDKGIAVTNYEKIRDDWDDVVELVEDRRVLIVYDEMPMKLKNRSTALYEAVCSMLYTCAPKVNLKYLRPAEARQFMMSATPIENDPNDWFSCVRILDPTIYGAVQTYYKRYVVRMNHFNKFKPEVWRDLDRIGLKAAHITHQVDKEKDPEIKAQFPRVIEDMQYIDWDPEDRKIYDRITNEIIDQLKEDEEQVNVLALIAVMQMICDAPSMVNDSAAARLIYEDACEAFAASGEEGKPPQIQGSDMALTLLEKYGALLNNDRHTKLIQLQEDLEAADGKTLVYSTFSDMLLPILSDRLDHWGISHVVYHGTDKQRQTAEDTFREDPDVRVFLSSDAGSDSINLEQANLVIDYNHPWKWTTKTQRHNRAHRITSEFESVRFKGYAMVNAIEDRKLEIIDRKKGIHEGVFGGSISDQALSARMTTNDLLYILLGETDYM